jgi:hypothetical protein
MQSTLNEDLPFSLIPFIDSSVGTVGRGCVCLKEDLCVDRKTYGMGDEP